MKLKTQPDQPNQALECLSTKSERSEVDAQSPLGVAATNGDGRLLASLGKGGTVESHFEACADVPRAGVFVALPALLASGLWKNTQEHFTLPQGYYQMVHLFLLVAFLALARIRSMESLRYCAPGEWGKILGLDRVPEVRTLREIIGLLGEEKNVAAWAGELSQQWMAEDPQSAGTLYVDGHVRTYHGSQAHLPKHYAPRQRLCLRATTDYWVNAMDGQPFFVVHRPVAPGLPEVLMSEIIPRLEREVPGQPSPEELSKDLQAVKFTVVFDREGFSPKGFKELNDKRIACLTYHKYPGTAWPEGDFKEHQVKLVHGNVETMKLAEKSLTMSNGFVVREIRLLETNGHQPPIIVTNHKLTIEQSAATMFARWSQENFLKYMREHYALDRLISYEKEKLDETTRVVNPAWRKLEHAVRSLAAKVNLKLRRFGAMSLPNTIEPEQMESALQKKESLQKEIQQLEQELEETKKRRADVPHHVKLGELPQNERFDRLSSGSKDLVDTIKLIAYRAQTAMSQIVRESLPKWRSQESRRLLQSLYSCEADLVPDTTANTLTVRIHYPANPMLGQAAQKLCDELSASETVFPTTKLRLIYKLVSAENPRGQEV